MAVPMCSASLAGLSGCRAPVTWVITAARFRRFACGRHLNRVCAELLVTGVRHMSLAAAGENRRS